MIGGGKHKSNDLQAGDVAFIVLWMAFLLVLLAQTLSFGRMARLVPLVVIVATLILLAALLTLKLRFLHTRFSTGNGREADLKSTVPRSAERDACEGDRKKRNLADEIVVMAWVGALVFLLYLAGFLVGAPLYGVLYLRLGARERWRTSLFTAGSLFLLLYLVFCVTLGFRLYPGRLWGWIGL